MRWLLRHWPGLLLALLAVTFIVTGIVVEVGEQRYGAIVAFVVAGLCLLLSVVSRFVPLDLGSYAARLREHALAAYRLWGHSGKVVGQVKFELERESFAMLDWLFANVSVLDRRLYAEMGDEEEEFWCAYLRYRRQHNETIIWTNRAMRRLYLFLRNRRTTRQEREGLVAREVLREEIAAK